MRCVTTPGLWDYPSFHHLWWIGEVSHQKRHRVSESPTNFGSITYERSYCRTGSRLCDFREIRPKCGPKYGRELVILCHFCEGFNGIFSRASHRIPSRCCSRHLQFFEIFGPAKARRSAHSRAILSDAHSCTYGLRDHVGLRKS